LVHEEVPVVNGRVAHGLQMFINLPAADQHREPAALHIANAAMPRLTQAGGARVKLGFGHYQDDTTKLSVAAQLPTAVSLLDVQVPVGGSFDYPIPAHTNALLYVVDGELLVGNDQLIAHQAVQLGSPDPSQSTPLHASSKTGAHCVLLLGAPLNRVTSDAAAPAIALRAT
jgi:quercetin 2,3-dioxygenase